MGVVKLVGLGGGIGAGKSTVSKLLASKGAAIVDADLIARQVVEPGSPALAAIVARFGANVLHEDGSMNRQAVAEIVFNDSNALADLNSITHPAIGREVARQIDAHLGSDRVVIFDAALLFDRAREGMVGKMVVDVDPEIAIARLVQHRGFAESDARARIRSQIGREERLALADFVIDNSADEASLATQVEAAWEWITNLPFSPTSGVSVTPSP